MKVSLRPAALITGGANRIGRAVALGLAAAGYDIALHYHRSSAAALKTAADIRKLGVDCDVFPADLAHAPEAGALMAGVVRRFARLALLVNSASVFRPSGFSLKEEALLAENMAVHVRAPWILSDEFVRLIASDGVIINFTDTAVTKNSTDHAAYLLSKKTLQAYTGMAAAVYAPGVRVNAVAPGFILPPAGADKNFIQRRAKNVPLGGPGRVEDVVSAVCFLAQNRYVTGQTIFVDGGEHLA